MLGDTKEMERNVICGHPLQHVARKAFDSQLLRCLLNLPQCISIRSPFQSLGCLEQRMPLRNPQAAVEHLVEALQEAGLDHPTASP